MATAAQDIAPATYDAIEERARQVPATIRHVDPGRFVTRRYVCQGAEINTGPYSDHRVIVRDAMPIRDHFELDVHGFTIATQPSAIRNFHNKEDVDRFYEREVERHVQALTGADKVVARGWMVRTSADLTQVAQEKTENYQHTGGTQPPAGEAHVDLNTPTARRRRPRTTSTPAESSLRRARRTSTSIRRLRSGWPSLPTRSIFPTARDSSAS